MNAFFKSLSDSELEYHLDDNPAEIINGEGAALFTEEEAKYLGETIPALREKYGNDEMWNVFIKNSKLASLIDE